MGKKLLARPVLTKGKNVVFYPFNFSRLLSQNVLLTF